MSAGPAIEVRAANGRVSVGAGGGVALQARRVALRIHEAALALLVMPPGGGAPSNLALESLRLTGEELTVDLVYKSLIPVPVQARVGASRTPEGTLRLAILGIKAASFLPLPSGLVGSHLARLEGKPGVVRVVASSLELDLPALVRHWNPDLNFPPLAEVRMAPGWVELDYAEPSEEPV